MNLTADNAAEVAAWCGGRVETVVPVAGPAEPTETQVVFVVVDGEERWVWPGATIERTPGGYRITPPLAA